MIARTLRGLGALAAVLLGLLGWPAALLAIGDGVSAWLPDLADPLSLLSRPDTGGLFLVIVLALAWAAWLMWSVALAVEVAAQVRGVPTPRLGGLFPQNAATALVTTIAVAFTLAPSSPAIADAAGADTAGPSCTSTSQMRVDRDTSTPHWSPTVSRFLAGGDGADAAVAGLEGDYTVVRGDTLWDIADEQLKDPHRWPEIAEASEQITQFDGRHLTDPDLILPGWTVSLSDQIAEAEPAEASPRSDEAGPAAEVTTPQTPMQAGTDPAADSSASAPSGVDRSTTTLADAIDAVAVRTPVLPPTPMGGGANQPVSSLATPPGGPTVHGDEGRASASHGVLGLPEWIADPLVPTHRDGAPDLVSAAEAQLATARSGHG